MVILNLAPTHNAMRLAFLLLCPMFLMRESPEMRYKAA
ncbi:hypothetical protein SAMN02744778_03140 [Pantoea sp. GL120224-02]|nr:hypothetical protein SAMN02744778_03140 [Pantoea sp. GL120224-02]